MIHLKPSTELWRRKKNKKWNVVEVQAITDLDRQEGQDIVSSPQYTTGVRPEKWALRKSDHGRGNESGNTAMNEDDKAELYAIQATDQIHQVTRRRGYSIY